ncbi:helix-turn-helix domain-containing protein [Actinomadura rupiterrae]|uniref:helix-turn-helix domain-containing protein n=1 Tax=Actinomadura rupiterrae TaxID=559627 RepID=UPI0020A2B255|nr:helix-turn-helix domain-containing protein [Actinomadura rupiterrae]MCP2337876.1 hypothetical protein [Actinomadura rupiterrae]
MGELVRRPGRPLKLLDDQVRERLLQAVEHGVPVDTAAHYVGISPRTFYRWAERGRRAEEQAADGRDGDPGEAAYRQFWQDLTRARAKGEIFAADVLHRLIAGGYPLRSRTRRYRDPATGQIVEETETDIAQPNLRAVIFYLERRHPETWGRHTAPDPALSEAAPGPGQADDGLIAFAARVRAARQRLETARQELQQTPDTATASP